MPERPHETGETGEAGDDAKTSALCAAVIGVALALGALALHGQRAAVSVGVGAVLGVANLLAMRAIVRAIVPVPGDVGPPGTGAGTQEEDGGESQPAKPAPDHRGDGKRGGAAWGVFAVLKMFLLFGGIFVLLTKGLVDPMPLVVGYGVLPLGIVASAAVARLRARRR
jgi:hypothetical protein